ncbi:MAG: hypothetical protein Q8L37_03255 [Candidatus Gottesmanbacteria bacterium]|nr:hypothetical protein [Candidatus Gottesmanbacteria bacterium]
MDESSPTIPPLPPDPSIPSLQFITPPVPHRSYRIWILGGLSILFLGILVGFIGAKVPSPSTKQSVVLPTSILTPTPSLAQGADIFAGWKTFTTNCNVSFKYPNDWNAKEFFLVKNDGDCGYLTAPGYTQGLDTRKGLYIAVSKILLGNVSNNIAINSIDDYIRSIKAISDPPARITNLINKSLQNYQGKQFDMSLAESQTIFVFAKDTYLYTVAWPSQFSGREMSQIDQILSTFKFNK